MGAVPGDEERARVGLQVVDHWAGLCGLRPGTTDPDRIEGALQDLLGDLECAARTYGIDLRRLLEPARGTIGA